MKPALVEEYVAPGRVRLEYRDYAFLGPESDLAAEAAFCAAEQNRFWRFHHTIFENQGRSNSGNFAEPRLRAMAEAVGLDLAAYDECMASERPAEHVAADEAAARELGIDSTPSVTIGGTEVEFQGYDGLKQEIDAALADAEA